MPATFESTMAWLNTSWAWARSLRPNDWEMSEVAPTLMDWVSASTMNIKLPARLTPATASLPSRPTK